MLHKRFVPNLKKIEIEITTGCNLMCTNCDRSVKQSPSGERMTAEQIQKFVDESIGLKREWEYIGLIGGEPTLHPDLDSIFEILKTYKTQYPYCVIEVVTNGYGDLVKNKIEKLPHRVQVRNSNKQGSRQLFSTYNVAPRDLSEYNNADFSSGCWITENCGLGLTRYGYYPCGAGASIDRIFGFNIGIKSLAEVSIVKLIKQKLAVLCSYCGHFKSMDPDKPELKNDWTYDEKISNSWIEGYKQQKEKKGNLTLY